MGRNWSPKYHVLCDMCGWTGKRTHRGTSNDCPKCGMRTVYLHPDKEARRIAAMRVPRGEKKTVAEGVRCSSVASLARAPK